MTTSVTYKTPDVRALESRIADLELDVKSEQRRLEDFRKKVVDVALDYAKANDWCGEVKDALEELGLTDLIPSSKRLVTVTISDEIDGEFGWDDEDYVNELLNGGRISGSVSDVDDFTVKEA